MYQNGYILHYSIVVIFCYITQTSKSNFFNLLVFNHLYILSHRGDSNPRPTHYERIFVIDYQCFISHFSKCYRFCYRFMFVLQFTRHLRQCPLWVLPSFLSDKRVSHAHRNRHPPHSILPKNSGDHHSPNFRQSHPTRT